jgi:uncharacterized membrane protein YebE (DUF533 family)
MGIVQIHERKGDSPEETTQTDSAAWVKFAAGGALIAGGLLLMANKRRAGLLVGATGAGLAVADQQETVRNLWNQVPGYIEKLQTVIGQVQDKVDAFSAKRDSLHQALSSFSKGA